MNDTGYKINTGADIKTLFAQKSSGTPTGSIIAYLGTTDVPGWILCDGILRTDNFDSKYNALFSLGIGSGGGGISNYVPPLLRNCVLRGNDGILQTIAGSNSATLNLSNIPPHSHNGTTDTTNIDHQHTYQTPQMNININQGDGGGSARGTQRNDPAGGTIQYDILQTSNMTNQIHSHTFTTSSVGSGTSFPIIPLHFKVNYLLKL